MGCSADTRMVVRRLYPRIPYERIETRPLLEVCSPPRGRRAIGVFGDGVLIATNDAHLYDPDILDRRCFTLEEWTDTRLRTPASYDDMFAYGRWRSGVMTRRVGQCQSGRVARQRPPGCLRMSQGSE